MTTYVNGLKAEGLEASTGNPRYLQVNVDFAAAAWNTVAKHEVLTVTGMVRLRIWIECTENVVGAGSLQFGHEDLTSDFIASTLGTDLDAGYLWYDATPTTKLEITSIAIMDYVLIGLDVGYEITGAVLSDGNLLVHAVWEPLSATGNVVAAAGGVL